MKKCKRKFLIIFGFLLAAITLIVPYSRETYCISAFGEYEEGVGYVAAEYPILPPNFDVRRRVRFNHNSWLSTRTVRTGYKLLPLYFADVKNHNKFKIWKKNKEEEGIKLKEQGHVLTPEEIRFYVLYEFIEEYKGEFQYNKFRLDIFIIEVVAILIITGVVYILFCLVLRKERRAAG